ncbi:MAG: amino acid ABC transporter permease, partial [Mesorhizobium sp.]
MQEHDLSFVRVEMALAQSAPPSERGLGAWIRKNLIASTGDTILTIIGIVLVAMILPQVINWAFISAQWTGTDRTVCATVAQGGIQPDGWSGACWAFVNAKFGQFMFGRYPIDERWRPILVAI